MIGDAYATLYRVVVGFLVGTGLALPLEDVTVKIARPRDPSSAEFNELKEELSLPVMEEQQRHVQEEIKLPAAD